MGSELKLTIKNVCVAKRGGFTCRAVPFSPNRTYAMHWAVRSRWAKAWQEAVWAEAMTVRQQIHMKNVDFPFAFSEIQVKIYTRRAQDDDNAMASLKPIIDGLRYAKIIYNDDPKTCRILPPITKVVKINEERTEIIIKQKKR